jgi:hypothetical protein
MKCVLQEFMFFWLYGGAPLCMMVAMGHATTMRHIAHPMHIQYQIVHVQSGVDAMFC